VTFDHSREYPVTSALRESSDGVGTSPISSRIREDSKLEREVYEILTKTTRVINSTNSDTREDYDPSKF
jgi:hypothetical protein